MSGHRKFSQLTKHFSQECQAAIAEKTAQIKKEIALSEAQIKQNAAVRNLGHLTGLSQ